MENIIILDGGLRQHPRHRRMSWCYILSAHHSSGNQSQYSGVGKRNEKKTILKEEKLTTINNIRIKLKCLIGNKRLV